MPNKEELNQYYKSAYWESRENINLRIILNRRDLIHFKILKNLFPQSIAKKKVFLNFGSGHGGVSHLLHDLGLEIINIEQGEMPNYYNKNWSKFSSTKSIKDDSVDVIYSSHSLEHVQNINEVQNEFKRIIKPEGILFFEVPNADSSSTGPKENKIVIPHTYYFQKIFFKNWFSKAILVKSFIQNDYEDIDNFMSYENPNGEIIIAIGVLH
jgi:2-polyprenyl-3-methyl-5-hydroxy-6-metoxy-1,4-benzoquinol methylase